MYFRKTCFLPCKSFVSLGDGWNVWGCVQDWKKSIQKGRTGKKKVAEYIYTHVTCIELYITCWQSQAISESQNVREGVTASCEYIWLIFVMWLAPNVWDKIKVMDVVRSTNHVIFLINRFSRLISLPMSTIFVLGTSDSGSHFLELPCPMAILKI